MLFFRLYFKKGNAYMTKTSDELVIKKLKRLKLLEYIDDLNLWISSLNDVQINNILSLNNISDYFFEKLITTDFF